MKTRSLTFHQGSRFSQAHNTRNEKVCAQQKHIDHARTGENEILVHEPVPDAYHRIFDAAVEKWNAMQKNAERRVKNYLTKIKKDGNGKKPAYEVVVQLGTRNDSGTDDEDAAAVLREYAHDFQRRNPSLVLIGAYIHRDEACTHLHLDYIPVAQHSERGMETQVSLTGALAELGYVGKNRKNTAQIQFQMAERAELTRLARQHGIEITQNVVSERREHLETEKYKEMATKIDEYQGQIREKAKNLKQNYGKLQEIEKNINTRGIEIAQAETAERVRAENIAALRAANDREMARQLRRAQALEDETEADSMSEFLSVMGLSEKYETYRAQRARERTRALSAALDERLSAVLRRRAAAESVVER